MPAPLLALALRLGITKAAQIVKDKGYKFLQRKVNKALKSKTKQQESAEKAYKGKSPKRKQEKVSKRKKAKVDSGLSIKKYPRSGKGKRSRNDPSVSEKGKGYSEQAYKTSIKVKVKFKDGKTITDDVKGMNEGHALTRAKSNWPGAAVIKIK